MNIFYLLFILIVILFSLTGISDLTGHFGLAQNLSNITFFLLITTLVLKIIDAKKNDK